MDKIKQNPKKILGVVALVLFVAAILFMLLPGLNFFQSETYEGETITMTLGASLFAYVFGGKLKLVFSGGGATESREMNLGSNPASLVAGIFLILIVVCVAILLFGLFTNKFNKKTIIAITVGIIILAVVSAILLLSSRSGMERTIAIAELKQAGVEPTEEYIQEVLKELEGFIKEGGKRSIGAGTIVTSIMALLGACSLGGVICLSAKEAK